MACELLSAQGCALKKNGKVRAGTRTVTPIELRAVALLEASEAPTQAHVSRRDKNVKNGFADATN
jgi:hypothetical protein